MVQASDLTPVEGSFEMTEEDLRAYAERRAQRPRGRLSDIVFWVAFLYAAVQTVLWVWRGDAYGPAYLVLALLLLSARYVFPPMFRRRALRRIDGPIHVKADHAGLTLSFGDKEKSAGWAHLVRHERTAEHFFFSFGRSGVFVVPRRAFADAETAERLWQLANTGTAENSA